ncbi:MAG: hypothetical protein GF317_09870 [Candidatus Lokiarchaeota archaeon]|nr:hypothetical protein [Candidatus Lokiarchaeota archaeon]
MFFINLILFIIIGFFICFAYVIIYLSSDRAKKFKTIAILFLTILFVFEIPHYLLPNNVFFDISVHIIAGISLFMFFLNVRYFPKKYRKIICIILVVCIIILIEIFLTILDLYTEFINPIGLNSFLDILWTTIGGVVGLIISYFIGKDSYNLLSRLEI